MSIEVFKPDPGSWRARLHGLTRVHDGSLCPYGSNGPAYVDTRTQGVSIRILEPATPKPHGS